MFNLTNSTFGTGNGEYYIITVYAYAVFVIIELIGKLMQPLNLHAN